MTRQISDTGWLSPYREQHKRYKYGPDSGSLFSPTIPEKYRAPTLGSYPPSPDGRDFNSYIDFVESPYNTMPQTMKELYPELAAVAKGFGDHSEEINKLRGSLGRTLDWEDRFKTNKQIENLLKKRNIDLDAFARDANRAGAEYRHKRRDVHRQYVNKPAVQIRAVLKYPKQAAISLIKEPVLFAKHMPYAFAVAATTAGLTAMLGGYGIYKLIQYLRKQKVDEEEDRKEVD